LPEKRPADEEPIEAEVVEEDVVEPAETPEGPAALPAAPPPAEAPQAPGPAPRRPYRGYRPRRRKTGIGLAGRLLFLTLLLVAAFLWRKELTDTYDALMDRFFGRAEEAPRPGPADVIVEVLPKPEPEPGPPKPTPPKPIPDTPLPTFEERTIPQLPAETLPELPPAERTPGLALAILDRRDLSVEGIFQCELYVLVPEDYGEKDLLRMAENVVTEERKRNFRHAIRLYCFKDRKSTRPEDAVAEVVWAPQGNFLRAREALRAGVDNNQYRVIMKDK